MLCRPGYANGAQPLCELPELRKMDHRLLAVRSKNKMANVGSSHNGCMIIVILRPSQRDIPTVEEEQ
jgi:hypothetical protein